ncbi:apolipoprotein N-acyltransferase [Mycolicibacterium fallax]|uniref:Apolipoprotein N-acyltransferase n=1 Tax=Mycolicibacterium fallax TaxID=1793 RepID=A0A1X1RHC1_MYCFA|nr:apolipoprotein N-acyltransferase [Mycolicibacterium fallax]BBY97662.1 apolipoprotein N-acyltransferase [Mycolicibacterium fallax]
MTEPGEDTDGLRTVAPEPDDAVLPEADAAIGQTPAGPTPAGPTPARRAALFAVAVALRFWAWLRPRLARMGVAVVAGLLMCASFPPIGWWWSAPLAFALLGWVLTRGAATGTGVARPGVTRPAVTYAGGFGYGLLFGLAFYLPLLPWISGLVGWFPWVMLGLLCALFPALFGLAAVVVRDLPGWPIWFALLWVSVEWLKTSIPFGGFPWGVTGFGQTTGPLLPLVQLGGVPLLSLGAALIGFSLGALALGIADWWRHGHHDLPPAVVLPGVCIAVVLMVAALTYPQVRRAGAGAGEDPVVTAAVVQGNVPRLGLEFNAQRRAVLDNHVAQTKALADEVHAGRQPQPQFVVWPENSSDIDPLANPDARAAINEAVAAIGAPILVGGVLLRPEATRQNPASSNSVIVWDPVDGPVDRHDKQIVQPFGEYLPWRSFFARLSSYAERAGYFVPGHGTGVVTAAGVPIGVSTCWEVIFDRAPRESVHNGAQVLAVPTNNATFNAAMSEQQLAVARARAVEHDRYVLVAGTTGISAIIAPDGREVARTEFFEPAFLDAGIRLKTTLTAATRWGAAIQWVLVAAGVGGLLAGIMQNGVFLRMIRRRRRPVPVSTEESHDR